MTSEVASRRKVASRCKGKNIDIIVSSKEAVNCSFMHSIRTIKAGLVTKILNVDSYGRPALKFKEIGAIYDSDGGGQKGSSSKFQQLEIGSEGSPFGSDRVKLETPLPMGGNVERVLDDGCGGNGGDINGNSDGNDLVFHEMTLQELRDRCKVKKRKLSKCVGIEECHPTRMQLKEEEFDLEEPLRCWKSMLLKKSKVERKRNGKPAFLHSLESAVSVKAEQDSSSFPLATQDSMPAAMASASMVHGHLLENANNIGIGFSQTHSMDLKNVDLSAHFSNIPCFTEADLFGKSSAELHEEDNANELGMEEPTLFSAKANLSAKLSDRFVEEVEGGRMEMGELASSSNEYFHCALNEASTQHQELGKSSVELPERVEPVELEMGELASSSNEYFHCALNEASTQHQELSKSSAELPERVEVDELETREPTSFITEMDLSGESSNRICKTADRGELEMGDSTSSPNGSPHCSLNEASTQYLELLRESFILPESGEEIYVGNAKMVFLETASHDCSPSSMFELKKDGASATMLLDSSPEAIAKPKDLGAEICSSCESKSSAEENSFQIHEKATTQMSDADIDCSLQCTELINGSDGCISDSEREDLEKLIDEVSMEGPTTRDSNEEDNSPSFDESSMAGEMVSESVNEAADCSTTESCSSTGIAALVAVAALENVCGEKAEHPPQRLLSTRKAISPASQEKLRRAANAEGSYTNIQFDNSGQRSLCFEKQAKNEALQAEADLYKAEVMMGGSKEVIKKSKTIKNGSLPSVSKGSIKSPHVSCVALCTCTQCALIRANAQKAISFAQRQMHDFEYVATKLVKGLKSMKDIMEEALLAEPSSSTALKSTVDEMKKAAEDAVGLEETTRKWLSMMGKDCTRFCKIMNTMERKTTTNFGGTDKRTKKVTFADEAGGLLSHVKVFEECPDSSSVFESEVPDQKLSMSEEVQQVF
ncbi:uncharacterized protein LOC131218516 isoform X2 [Magnolia sinica]|uniref:uncharacterized protein LOC131218516 isoform X2 n=1 Tax=Magnolia sinica TaxID=86752 RepID=UPI002657F3DD|nr:uncharacterized protein LOC131218516 isoform X2 [Magnolia sinica]